MSSNKKFKQFKAKKPVTSVIKSSVDIEVENAVFNTVTIQRNYPVTLVERTYLLNQELLQDKRDGKITHEFSEEEAQAMIAIEFVCLN